jgi:hypothetical protein
MAAQLVKSALPIAISCLLFVVLGRINQAAYRSGGWDQFYEYNNEKTSMIDFKYLTTIMGLPRASSTRSGGQKMITKCSAAGDSSTKPRFRSIS